MSKSKLFNLEIDVSDVECLDYGSRWANYGTIIAEGDTLEELLDSAQVDVTDQDGGTLALKKADSGWMQGRIIREFAKSGSSAEEARLEVVGERQGEYERNEGAGDV